LIEQIQILPVSLLNQERARIEQLKHLAHSLRLEFGWHYLLDLVWILSQMQLSRGLRVIDAGAGVGVMQWYLAERGLEVISVDRDSRANLPARFRLRFQVRGLRPGDLQPLRTVLRTPLEKNRVIFKRVVSKSVDTSLGWVSGHVVHAFDSNKGSVLIYNQDLRSLLDIPDCSIDAIVAVSALEHNDPENMGQVVAELMRVLKPGRPLLATLCAAKEHDWFHEPSSGWCYTESTLKKIFDLSCETPSNYSLYDALFAQLRDCSELRENLAQFYFRSGDNGMPWGRWDPKYQPVGICKIKPDA
jgi:SAM-dependent methyltransferase